MTERGASVSKIKESTAQFRCIECGTVTENADRSFRCAHCGDLLEITCPGWKTLDAVSLKSTWLQRRASHLPVDVSGVWRYRELLPTLRDSNHAITLKEGNTPLYDLPRCARASGLRQLFAKHQGMNPTGSFKDTGMTLAASFAREQEFQWVACASTGNTSASMAAYASRGGMRSLVLIPEGHVSWGKLSQSLDYGAVTCQLKTNFDGCMRVLNEIVQRKPVYLLNSINPYRLEGQKTTAIELLESLNWESPDHIIVPGGNMGNSSALGKALLEMKDLGLISRLPKLSVIQAEGANSMVRTMRETGGRTLISVEPETMATAIRIGSPASWKKAARVLQTTGGTVEQVSEAEIALSKAEIGSDGVGCEPASAVTLAGLKKLVTQGFVKAADHVVLILTGHVLKDPDFTLKFHRGDVFEGKETAMLRPQQRAPIVLDASAESVIRVLEDAENSASL